MRAKLTREGGRTMTGATPHNPMPINLLAEIRHRLRTSVNHIIGYGEMLAEQIQARGESDRFLDLGPICASGLDLLGTYP